MKSSMHLACLAGALLALGAPAFAETVTVSPGNMGSWSFVTTDDNGNPCPTCGSGGMVTGPAGPGLLGTGSANLQTATDNGQYASAIVSSALNGQLLSSITALSYSTYDVTNNGSQFPYLQLMVSWAGGTPLIGNSGPDDILTFEPPYQTAASGNPSLPDQGPTFLNTWQNWNALEGGWYDNYFCGPGADSSEGHGVCSLATLIGDLPSDATITADWNGNGGTELLVGYGSQGENYDGNVDDVTIGISGENTTYDFEPAPEPGTFLLLGAGLAALAALGRRAADKLS